MAPSIPALVAPVMLVWARETVGLDPVGAARKIGVADDRVADWEAGTEKPTMAQLKKAADVYKRPLGVFFLAEPPTTFDVMRDFRRLDEGSHGEWSVELHAEFRRALDQRDHALQLAELDDQKPTTSWRLDHLPESTAEIAEAARQRLLSLAPTGPTGVGTKYEHLNRWIGALEEGGVLVLATQRGGVTLEEMRAFSLHFDYYPVIVVNGSDSPRGRLFSAMHEYAHLLLHTAGLCDTVSDAKAMSPDRQLETRCNAIAAEILMPDEAVRASQAVRQRKGAPATAWDYYALREAAAPFGVSAEAFLRRLVVLRLVDPQYYDDRRQEFLAAYANEEERSKAGGGDWYRTTVRDLGKWWVRRVADARQRRVIDSYTAATFLGVKVDQIPRLAETASVAAEI